MATIQPLDRLRYAERQIDHCREDVDEWKRLHDDVKQDCWVWEDMVDRANDIFSRFLNLDVDIQQAIFAGRMPFNEDIDRQMRDLLRSWLELGEQLLPEVLRLEQKYGQVDGATRLRVSMAEAKGMLTPDVEFFGKDELAGIRDKAIEEHRNGLTEPLP